MATKLTDNYFQFGQVKYFRGKAENIKMGAFGDKEDPAGSKSHVEVFGVIKPEYLDSRVDYITTTSIDWGQTTKAVVEVNGPLKFFGLNGKGALTASYEKAKTENFKLTKLSMTVGELQGMLNTDAYSARKYLADEGGDGRIVAEIWVVVDAKLAEHYQTYAQGSASFKVGGDNLEFTVTGGTNGSQTISLATGTCFAYSMYKVKNWSNHKTHIDKMEADYQGIN